MSNNTSVPGSGTAAIASPDEPATGDPASEGSKMNVPPAPTVKLVPTGKAAAEVAISVPASTVVLPV